MELSVSSEMTFFNKKLQLEICPQLRTGIDTRGYTNKKKQFSREKIRALDTIQSIS